MILAQLRLLILGLSVAANAAAAPVNRTSVEVSDHVSLSVLSSGQKGNPLILFIHGFPEIGLMWQDYLEHFGDKFYAVAPDLRGYNLSSKPQGVENYHVDQLASDMANLVKKLGYHQVNVVGHDWGGVVSRYFAEKYPQMVQKTAIVNMCQPERWLHLRKTSWEQRKKSWYLNITTREGAHHLGGIGNFSILRSIMNFSSNKPRTAAYNKALVEAWNHEDSMKFMLKHYQSLKQNEEETTKTLRGVQNPLLIAFSENDAFFDVDGCIENSAQFGSQVRVIHYENESHWLPTENPQKLIPDLERFIAE